MPVRPENRARYSPHWKAISALVRFKLADNRCEFCGAANHEPHPVTGSRVILTVAHLDHRPENNVRGNLRALCQRCHNSYDAPHRRANRRERLPGTRDLFTESA